MKLSPGLVVIAAFTFTASLFATEPLDGLDNYVGSAMKEWHVPGVALAIVKDGKVLACRGYGVTTHGGDAVTEDTAFPLASITKNFTATAIGVLVEEGKLTWDDPLVKHLPNLRFSDDYRTKHTTIRDLLCHRTGLERADLLWLRGDLSHDEVVHRVRFLKPVAGFRERFGYNNLMYCVAGELVGEVANSSWEQFVTERLLKPLEMRSTAVAESLPVEKRAVLNRRNDGSIVPGNYCHVGTAPAGGMQSTAADMSKWLLASLASDDDPSLLSLESRRHMRAIHTSVPVDYDRSGNRYAARFYGVGLGWSTHEYQGRALSYHTGSTGTVFATLPGENFGVVVLANLDWSNFSVMLMYDILDAYFVGPEKTWDTDEWEFFKSHDTNPDNTRQQDLADAVAKRTKDTQPELPLAKYVGRYACDLYGDITVASAEDELTLQFGDNPPARATHWENNVFYVARPTREKAPTERWLVKFSVEDGHSHSLSVDQVTELSYDDTLPEFKRVEP